MTVNRTAVVPPAGTLEGLAVRPVHAGPLFTLPVRPNCVTPDAEVKLTPEGKVTIVEVVHVRTVPDCVHVVPEVPVALCANVGILQSPTKTSASARVIKFIS